MNPLPPFPHVMVVEASAGSGKTYTLARRYLQLLINPALKPREIPMGSVLAVTFTNKAAAEMKERILDFLKRIALDAFADERQRRDLLSSFGVTPGEARLKAGYVLEEILRNYNYFQIKTIDSLINGILSGCAFKLDLSAYFRTEPSHESYLAYSVDLLIDLARRDASVAALFGDFLRQYLFIERKSGWFPREDILKVINGLFSKNNTHSGDFLPSAFDMRQVGQAKLAVLGLLRRLHECLPEQTHARFRGILATFLLEHSDGFSIDEISNYFGRSELPVRSGGIVPPEAASLWKAVRQGLAEVCELEAVSLLNAYIAIFSRVVAAVKEVTRRDDVLFLEALNKEAHLLFTSASLSLPELYYRLATRFRHFLIDEFQDTSLLQWDNFHAMALEALSSGGSLFYVGDRKQAIYRFRGGDLGFIDVVRDQLEAFAFIEDTLRSNYRSAPEIVRFNNSVFSPGALGSFFAAYAELKGDQDPLADDQRQRIAAVFASAEQDPVRTDKDGYVQVRWYDNRSREELYPLIRQGLAETIADCRQRYSFGDLCVLVRTNDEVERLTGWMHSEGIPVSSEKTLDMRENPCIKELLSFLRFLRSPIDNISFASFVLGGVFQRSSNLGCDAVRDFLFASRQAGPRAGYLYREFRQAFPVEWEECIEPFFTSVGYVPLYELVVSIYHRFNVMVSFPGSQGFLMRFLELITRQEARYAGLGEFLEYLESAPDADFFVRVAEADAVRVLTVHKAKGLEFPVVVVPFAELNVKPEQDVVVAQGAGLSLVRLRSKYGLFSPRLDRLQKAEFGQAFLDELNTLYVALTRARDELYCFVPQRGESGPNPARLLLAAGIRGVKTPSPEPSERGRLRTLAPSVHGDWVAYLKEERFDPALVRSRASRLKGECAHAILAGIGNLHGTDAPAALADALARAKGEFSGFDGWEDAGKRAGALLNRPALTGFFACPGARVLTEQEIVTPDGATVRVDRLIIAPGEVTVIDFKSSRENRDDSVRQVRGYAAHLIRAYPGRAVRAVLVYLDSLDSEEVALP